MSPPERVAVLSTGRQDFGILRSTVRALDDDPRFDLRLWIGGMHLSERYGRTIDLVREDGFRIDREVGFVREPPDPLRESAGAVVAVGEALEVETPDCLLLVGDRSETLAAGVAATLARVALVHLHGGEETQGAVDNAFRHALTKLSHLHLVSDRVHAQRVRQMGEDPAAVIVVGAPGLDNLHRPDLVGLPELEERLGVRLKRPLVMVTVHPTTLAEDMLAEARAVTSALEDHPGTVIVTAPNADQGGAEIRTLLEAWTEADDRRALVDALGERLYWSMLREVDVVVGNSSSGIIEAPAAGAPVVNVGDRQGGRVRAAGSLWDVPAAVDEVRLAIDAALTAGRDPAVGEGDVTAAGRIVRALAEWEVPHPPAKPFVGPS